MGWRELEVVHSSVLSERHVLTTFLPWAMYIHYFPVPTTLYIC